jgi:hypothetical protein
MFVIVPPQSYYQIVEYIAAPIRAPADRRQFLGPVRDGLGPLVQHGRVPDHADLEPHVVRGLPAVLHPGAGRLLLVWRVWASTSRPVPSGC